MKYPTYLLALFLAACSSVPTTAPQDAAGPEDTAEALDASPEDTGLMPQDTGTEASQDTGRVDVAPPLDAALDAPEDVPCIPAERCGCCREGYYCAGNGSCYPDTDTGVDVVGDTGARDAEVDAGDTLGERVGALDVRGTVDGIAPGYPRVAQACELVDGTVNIGVQYRDAFGPSFTANLPSTGPQVVGYWTDGLDVRATSARTPIYYVAGIGRINARVSGVLAGRRIEIRALGCTVR